MSANTQSLSARWKLFVQSEDCTKEYLTQKLVDCWNCLREITSPEELRQLTDLVGKWKPQLQSPVSRVAVVSCLQLWQNPFVPIPRWIRDKIPFENVQIGRLRCWIAQDDLGIRFLVEFLDYLVGETNTVTEEFLPNFRQFALIIRGKHSESE